MRRRNPRATAGGSVADNDSQPVMVPRSDRTLATTSPERSRRLRQHLVTLLRASHTTRNSAHPASLISPEPSGFAAQVALAACSLCKGWCCKGGGNDGYLDEPTIARVRRERPELNALAVVRLYARRVPAAGYEGSCIFHGKQGCTIDRSLRSEVCNSYFCNGLHAYMTGGDPETPVVVIAGEGDKMHTSPTLIPPGKTGCRSERLITDDY